ncbi:MAG: hypothetical protein Q7U54_17035 [Bacteroidales bacterium]|nr:hypothetical protein [Bacteroidales bacterium]
MQYPGYNSGNVILSEGKWFPFKIHNLVQLQDDAWYYVLQDINGMKHFMAAGNYKSYGFIVGDQILCKIDKVNCTGRVFLEPKHPIYEEGEIYYFDFISYSDSGLESVLMVKENFGNIVEVVVNGTKKVDINEEKRVRCSVKSITKGRLVLEIQPDCN